jgi:hypothetical protein
MSMFALVDRKKCFLSDLAGVTIEEMNGWVAFYELMEERVRDGG